MFLFTATLIFCQILALFVSSTSASESGELDENLSGSGRASFQSVEGFVLACGGLFEDFDPVVSLSPSLFGNGSYCGKTIRISSGNKTVNGKVEDICPGCGTFDLDLSPILFEIFAPLSDGLVQVSWTILDD